MGAGAPCGARHRSLAGRCGIPREDERVYVAVRLADVAVAPGRRAGRPAAVRWPDGRTWPVQGVFATQRFGREELGNLCQRWDVEIQGRRVELWWEHGAWFVAKGSGLAA